MEISQRLLSKVLEEDIYELSVEFNVVEYKSTQFRYISSDTINIYELAHKCKEWAFNNGYELRSGRDIDVKEELCYFCEYKQERQLDYANGDYFLADTETESIFKACQWILHKQEG